MDKTARPASKDDAHLSNGLGRWRLFHSIIPKGNRHPNPLCHGMPPRSLMPYGITQLTTSASLVPLSSQQFNVKSGVHCLQSCPKISASLFTSNRSSNDPVIDHPLPLAMREVKISLTSIVHPTSSSLPQFAILFLWR
ncbi:hypothetical protein AVEN_108363-1 [Araneus ventricosus]|uniref:Uncharacterized protein n=1 Tax=Araneus ventricosus TaxID=182803 RepID=A0A4Y2CV95_ARAVE|nr:hypothetical protein AVEN_108363-1 [Araneus ventricosus]